MIVVSWDDKPIEVPYTVRLHDVTDELFDRYADEDTKAELLDGEMIVHSPASLRHDDVGGFLRALMRFYAEAKSAGAVLGPDSLVRLAAGRRLAPDVFYLRKGRRPRRLPKEFSGAPDLVIEVISPSNRRTDVTHKRRLCREAGVAEIWLVDPDQRTVTVDRRRDRQYVEETIASGKVCSAALDGFWIDAAWLFRETLPSGMECLRAVLGEPAAGPGGAS